MNSWAPLSDGIVDSSIWEEPDHVFRVFLGMMSLKGPDHVVRMDSYKLSRRLHMEHVVVLDALKILESPDNRREGQEHEGRRLKAVEGGWFFLNGGVYRDQVQKIMKRARDARAQANWRARKAGKPLPYPSVRKIRENHSISEEELAAHSEVQRSVQALNEIQGREELEGGNEAERIAATPKGGVVWVKSVAQAVGPGAWTEPVTGPSGRRVDPAAPEVTISLDESPSGPGSVPAP
jgi:hypothetical protein